MQQHIWGLLPHWKIVITVFGPMEGIEYVSSRLCRNRWIGFWVNNTVNMYHVLEFIHCFLKFVWKIGYMELVNDAIRHWEKMFYWTEEV